MPYISRNARTELNFDPPIAATQGELNYLLSMVAEKYLQGRAFNYGTLSEVMGAFESAKSEFYRRVVAPYEDIKLAEHGDVYGHRRG